MLAHVTRSRPLAPKELFSDDYGFREAQIASGEELQAFLGTVDDVVAMQPVGELQQCRLWMGGRKLPGRSPAGMTPGQAMAVWEIFSKSGATWATYLKIAQSKREACEEWCRERREQFTSKWAWTKEQLTGEEDDEEIQSIQSEARSEAATLEGEMKQRADALRDEIDKGKTSLQAEIQNSWQAMPDALASAWKKIRVER